MAASQHHRCLWVATQRSDRTYESVQGSAIEEFRAAQVNDQLPAATLESDPDRIANQMSVGDIELALGRNHHEFGAGEEPPWRWLVPGRYPGWSS